MIKTRTKKKGFTLVEVMISTAIFTLVMTLGIGALLNVTSAYKASQAKKIVNDNLNFLMEGMSREIRLGVNYYANSGGLGDEGSVNNGSASSIGFTAVENRGYFVYYENAGVIYRRRYFGGEVFTEQLTNINQIRIKEIDFNVVGANEGGIDTKQAFVWMFIRGVIPNDDETSVSIQTLVSQRKLDVS